MVEKIKKIQASNMTTAEKLVAMMVAMRNFRGAR